jgi:hypothetical protein
MAAKSSYTHTEMKRSKVDMVDMLDNQKLPPLPAEYLFVDARQRERESTEPLFASRTRFFKNILVVKSGSILACASQSITILTIPLFP